MRGAEQTPQLVTGRRHLSWCDLLAATPPNWVVGFETTFRAIGKRSMGAIQRKTGESRSLLGAFRETTSGKEAYRTEIPCAYSASTSPPRVGFRVSRWESTPDWDGSRFSGVLRDETLKLSCTSLIERARSVGKRNGN
jgi:hypothetical protein